MVPQSVQAMHLCRQIRRRTLGWEIFPLSQESFCARVGLGEVILKYVSRELVVPPTTTGVSVTYWTPV